jgi:acyl carrier protein
MDPDNADVELEEIKSRLKKTMIEQLSLEDLEPSDIEDDGELFGEGLGLDSLDAVEIVVLLQRHFGVEIKTADQSREVFRSINTLARYILNHRNQT